MIPASRILRAVRVLLAASAVLVIAAAGYVFLASERIIHHEYEVPLLEVAVPTDSNSVIEGRRLAAIRGCFGCHGEKLEGAVFMDNFRTGRAVAPNLTRVAHEYSTAELARAIRYGVRANGEGLQIMPSPMYYHLSDADLGRIIAVLRAIPRVDGPGYEFRPGPMTRWRMVQGEWYSWTDDVLRMGPRMLMPETSDSLRYGEYLARTSCTECHGNEFEGGMGSGPDLAITAAYSLDEFIRFMKTGRAIGDRELRMMSGVARSRFSHFTDSEIRALFAFLQSRGNSISDERPNKR